MLPGSLTVTCGGAGELVLLGERAALIPAEGLLLVADAHLGKAHAFRRLGVPVPRGTTNDNLQRLSDLLRRTAARRLVFLGDLLHAARGCTPATLDAIGNWRAGHADVEIGLVRGNHDPQGIDLPALGLTVADGPCRVGGWALCHHPQADPGHYVLSGHLHPCITVRAGLDRLRLPCFQLGPEQAVLPAFGSFTGMHPVERRPGDRVAVVVDGEVRALPEARAVARQGGVAA